MWAALAEGARPVLLEMQRFDAQAGWDAIGAFERSVALRRSLVHPGLPAWLDDFPLRSEGAAAGAIHALVYVGELIEGPTLGSVPGGLSPLAMVTWLDQILDVLAFVHGRAPPVCHGDVHPGQIQLGRDGRARLLGLNVVASLTTAEADAGLGDGGGTFGFAAPERLAGRATVAGDLFSLGMTFLAVATGLAPEDLPRERERVVLRDLPNVAPPLARLIGELVHPDPRGRPASAAHVRAALAPIARRLAGGIALEGEGASARMATGAAGGPGMGPAGGPGRGVVGGPGMGVQGGPVMGAAGAGVEAYLDDLADRLTAAGLSWQRGGLLDESTLALEAHAPRDAGPPLHVYVARAGELEGSQDATRPVGPIPAALFAQAAAGAGTAAAGLGAGLGAWLGSLLGGARAVVVPVIVAPAGFGSTVAGHLAASLREPEGTSIICGLVDLRARRVVVVCPRSLAAADPEGLLARVRELLEPIGSDEPDGI